MSHPARPKTADESADEGFHAESRLYLSSTFTQDGNSPGRTAHTRDRRTRDWPRLRRRALQLACLIFRPRSDEFFDRFPVGNDPVGPALRVDRVL